MEIVAMDMKVGQWTEALTHIFFFQIYIYILHSLNAMYLLGTFLNLPLAKGEELDIFWHILQI